jgi:hypothetical protein
MRIIIRTDMYGVRVEQAAHMNEPFPFVQFELLFMLA